MGVKFHSLEGEKLTYSVIPEVVEQADVDAVKRLKRANMETNGFSDGKNLRAIASIPLAVLYNYAGNHGISWDKAEAWYNENSGKRLKELINEFNAFRIVDKL